MKLQWRLTREQFSLAVARGLDNWPTAEGVTRERWDQDTRRYGMEPVLPMALLTILTLALQFVAMIGAVVWFLRNDPGLGWWTVAPVAFLGSCQVIGRLYMRGYDRVWSRQEARAREHA